MEVFFLTQNAQSPFEKRRHQSHDALFKDVFENKKYSLDLFKLIFKPLEFKLFDWDTLKPELRSYIDHEGKEKRIDLLFSVKMKGLKEEVKLLFLLEHKSYKYDLIFEQLLSYQSLIYKKKKYEYPILPIVFYHGKNKDWRGPLSFQDFIKKFHPILRRYFSESVLNFKPKILNVHKIDLFSKKSKKLISKPVLLIMSAIWNLNQKTIEDVLKMGSELGLGEDQSFLIQKIADYISRCNPKFTFDVIRKIEEKSIPEELRVMSALQCTLDEEREKGIQQGREEYREEIRKEVQKEKSKKIALRMIQDGLGLKTITLYTGLTLEEVEKLQKEDKKV